MAEPKTKEGAPKLETPEQPAAPPREVPRSEEPDLETPEEPREDTRVLSYKDFVAETAAPADESDLHVSRSPVDAHAPVWLGRIPNSP